VDVCVYVCTSSQRDISLVLALLLWIPYNTYLVPSRHLHCLGLAAVDALEALEEGDEGGGDQVGAHAVVELVATVVPQVEEEQDGAEDLREGAALHGQLQEES
jgi:hypothetical protein